MDAVQSAILWLLQMATGREKIFHIHPGCLIYGFGRAVLNKGIAGVLIRQPKIIDGHVPIQIFPKSGRCLCQWV